MSNIELPDLPYPEQSGPPGWPEWRTYSRDQMRAYAEEAVRQALAAQAKSLRSFADRKYCAAIEYARRNEALGWEGKVKSGLFGHDEYACHKKMNEAYGAHFGIYEALEQIAPTPETLDG